MAELEITERRATPGGAIRVRLKVPEGDPRYPVLEKAAAYLEALPRPAQSHPAIPDEMKAALARRPFLSSVGGAAGHWITAGGGPGPDGEQHTGGAHIFIEETPEGGRAIAGPPGAVDAINRHLEGRQPKPEQPAPEPTPEQEGAAGPRGQGTGPSGAPEAPQPQPAGDAGDQGGGAGEPKAEPEPLSPGGLSDEDVAGLVKKAQEAAKAHYLKQLARRAAGAPKIPSSGPKRPLGAPKPPRPRTPEEEIYRAAFKAALRHYQGLGGADPTDEHDQQARDRADQAVRRGTKHAPEGSRTLGGEEAPQPPAGGSGGAPQPPQPPAPKPQQPAPSAPKPQPSAPAPTPAPKPTPQPAPPSAPAAAPESSPEAPSEPAAPTTPETPETPETAPETAQEGSETPESAPETPAENAPEAPGEPEEDDEDAADEEEPPAPPEPSIHAKHAAELRRLAAGLPIKSRRPYLKAASTLDSIDEDPGDEANAERIADHEKQSHQLYLGGSGLMHSNHTAERTRDERAAHQEHYKVLGGVPNKEEKTWQMPPEQLHNALRYLPDHDIHPDLLKRGSELLAAGKMAANGEQTPPKPVVPKPSADPADKPGEVPGDPNLSPEQAIRDAAPPPPESDLPESATTPIPTAPATLRNELLRTPEEDGLPDTPWNAYNVEHLPSAGELPEANREEAMLGYADELDAQRQRNLDAAQTVWDQEEKAYKKTKRNERYGVQRALRDNNEWDLAYKDPDEYTQEEMGRIAKLLPDRVRLAKASAQKLYMDYRQAADNYRKVATKTRAYAYNPELAQRDHELFARAHDAHEHTKGSIGFHPATGRVLWHNAEQFMPRAGKFGALAPTPKERSLLAGLSGYTGESSKRNRTDGHISFNPTGLAQAVAHFPKHVAHIAPKALEAAAAAHAKSQAPVTRFEHPPLLRTGEEGGKNPFPYQQYAAQFNIARQRAQLAMGTGAGKTLTGAATFCRLHQLGLAHKAVVLCPDNIKETWHSEFKKLTHIPHNKIVKIKPRADCKKGEWEQQWERAKDAMVVVAGHGGFQQNQSQAEAHQAKLDAFDEKIGAAREEGREVDVAKHNAARDEYLQNKVRSLAKEGKTLEDLDSSTISDRLVEMGFDHLIADEAHAFKNARSGRTKKLREMFGAIPYQSHLSGTIMPNSPTDLLSGIDNVSPGLVGTEAQFVKNYVDRQPILGAGGKVIGYKDLAYHDLDKLFHQARSVMLPLPRWDPNLRAQQGKVGLSVPNANFEYRPIAMSGAQNEMYEKLREHGLDMLNSMNEARAGESGEAKKAVLPVLGQLMEQVAIDPRLLDFSKFTEEGMGELATDMRSLYNQYLGEQREAAGRGQVTGGAKIQEAVREIQNHHANGGRGATIYADYVKAAPLLQDALRQAGYHDNELGYIKAGNAEGNAELMRRFNDPKDPLRVLLLSSAAKEGLNLQGEREQRHAAGPLKGQMAGGNLSVLLHQTWLPGDKDQIHARISRLGQEGDTYHLELLARTADGGRTIDRQKLKRSTAKAEASAQAQFGKPGARVEIPQLSYTENTEDMDEMFGGGEDEEGYNETKHSA